MLTNLCNCVYEALRPFLIHVNHIEILIELCDLLIHEFIEDKSTANPSEFCNLAISYLLSS